MVLRSAQAASAHEVDLLLGAELLSGQAASARPASRDGLHVCPACRRPFVVAAGVREVVDLDHARVALRCCDCGWGATSVQHDRDLRALELHVDRSYAELLWTLELVWRANEEHAIARFAAALDSGALLPEDF